MTFEDNASIQPLVSIIVPTRNSERYLSSCLQSIRDQNYPNVELIVVDRYSIDTTVAIAEAFGAKLLFTGPERSAQINAGARASNGQLLFRVDSDFRLEPTVVSECVNLVAGGADAVVVHNTAIDIGWLSRIRKFEVDMYKFSLDHSAARFISKSAFLAIGGYAEDITAGEDYDFQNRITLSGFETFFCNAEAIHLDEPTHLSPVLRKYFQYGRDFPKYRRQNLERSQIQLAFFRKDFFKHRKRLLERPMMTMGLIAYHSLKYAAGGIGYLSALIWRPESEELVAEKSDAGGSANEI